MYCLNREVTVSKKKIGGGGDPDASGFESIVSNVKKEDTFVPFEQILDAQKLPKRSEDYHLFQSNNIFHT